MVKIADYLDKDLVLFLDVNSRDAIIKQLVNKLADKRKVIDREKFYEAILNREAIVSTGVGMGVAIPHAKLPDLNQFFIAIGIQKKGVDWKALDHLPVSLVFLIGGPDDKQTQYLQILSQLTISLRDAEKRKKLLTYSSSEEIIKLFKND